MRKINTVKVMVAIISVTLLLSAHVLAGVPFTNLEGVGGAAFNPFAYLANAGTELGEPNSTLSKIAGRPQIGAWYVNLDESDIDWTSIGYTQTFFKRVELSYAQENISKHDADNITKDNFGAKLLMIEENAWDTTWLPAISVGVIGKHTSPVELVPTADSSGYDVYLVATKLITNLPKPVMLSGGVLSTDGLTTGVLGYSDKRDTIPFGNVDLILLENMVVGLEYKHGAKLGDFENANYWDAHVAWLVNKNLTLIGAYVNAGNEDSDRKCGLGEGMVLSLQYAF